MQAKPTDAVGKISLQIAKESGMKLSAIHLQIEAVQIVGGFDLNGPVLDDSRTLSDYNIQKMAYPMVLVCFDDDGSYMDGTSDNDEDVK